ncbi:MAG TPA: hypothetical protein PLL06_12680, partial [Acidobacteriota bacterium]|nr:hypothetical protein [Acidobacteriota bacterium]
MSQNFICEEFCRIAEQGFTPRGRVILVNLPEQGSFVGFFQNFACPPAPLLLVFGGGLLIQVPLYHSNREAWRAVAAHLPADVRTFVDLGCGLGGLLA